MKTKHTSPFPYTDGFKRYYTLDWALKQRFGKKICKIPLSSGLSCPNRDGTRGVGGCTFCTGDGGGEFAPTALASLETQYAQGKNSLGSKWPQAGFAAYFQAFTNTHIPLDGLESLLRAAVALPEVMLIRIATRADCLDAHKVALLAHYSKQVPVELELGLQTVHDKTAQAINRCHSYAEFLTGYRLAQAEGLYLCVHLINGLPNESHAMMLDSARALALLRPNGVKLHMLHLQRGSALAAQYEQSPFPLLDREAYIALVCNQLELLPPETIIERLTGDGAAASLVAPLWTKNKLSVLNGIDKALFDSNSWQGRLYVPAP